MDFKEKLQILRTQMKISQEELAVQLNISRQSVTKWENGQSYPMKNLSVGRNFTKKGIIPIVAR